MAISVIGYGGAVAEVGGTNFRAVSVNYQAYDYGTCGIYRKSLKSGTMAAGLVANSPVYSFRWTDVIRLVAVQRVILDGVASLAAFTAGFASLQLFVARSFTGVDSGGTAGTLTGHNSKLRTDMGTTLLGDIRIASTGTLTAGTRTLDTDPVGELTWQCPATTTNIIFARQVYLLGTTGANTGADMPTVLLQNEGLVLQAVVPATGTWQFGVTTQWAEVVAF